MSIVKLNKSILRLVGVVLTLAVALYFTGAAVAQSQEPRLIKLLEPELDINGTLVKETDLSGREREVPVDVPQEFPGRGFVVYGRAAGKPGEEDTSTFQTTTTLRVTANEAAGITQNVDYRPIVHSRERTSSLDPNPRRMPDLETFFEFGGTVELLAPLSQAAPLEKYDLVMSELMWGVDTGLRDTPGTVTVTFTNEDGQEQTEQVVVPQLVNQEVQWFELYNTTDSDITTNLFLLFSPFVSHPDRDTVELKAVDYPNLEQDTEFKVLDAVSNLLFGRWRLPGKSGRRPTTAFVSAYRNIDYATVENPSLSRNAQLAGLPFGSYVDAWEATPDAGRRNTELIIIVGGEVITRRNRDGTTTEQVRGRITELPYIATPGTKHVPDVFIRPLRPTRVDSNAVVINEVRNDTSPANIDWIELKNVGSRTVDLEEWELSIVTAYGEDNDLVDLPAHELRRDEILLIVNQHPYRTELKDGINIEEPEEHLQRAGATHKYLVAEDLDLPTDKQFLLLLRSEYDQNGKDAAIMDYAGNGFFSDHLTTQIWPLLARPIPIGVVANFGTPTFAFRERDRAWARIRYEKDDGYHKDAWKSVATQGGIGYAPDADLTAAPGTPGYENNALKTQLVNRISPNPEAEYDDGEISISEIMYHPGPNGNSVQWIELYNVSKTQAVNIKDWELEIRNFESGYGTYADMTFVFLDAVLLPNQTLLIVSERASNNLPRNNVYNLFVNHRSVLRVLRNQPLLNPDAFYIKLTDTADLERDGDNIVVDEVGNLSIDGPGRSKLWDLPHIDPERRRSIVRRYGGIFKHADRGRGGRPNPPNPGTTADGWRRFPADGSQSMSFYGYRSDAASPGYRLGGPLPVVLSSFRPVRNRDTGGVDITWVTASELNNAGFNVLRAERRDTGFSVINEKGIIPGHGTTSEQHIYTYTDTTAKPDVVYYYRLEDVAFDGTRQPLATVRLKGEVSAFGKVTTTWGDLKSENKSGIF